MKRFVASLLVLVAILSRPARAAENATAVILQCDHLWDGTSDRLTGPMPPLGPGRWRVEWQVLSTDGHVVSGRFDFNIAP